MWQIIPKSSLLLLATCGATCLAGMTFGGRPTPFSTTPQRWDPFLWVEEFSPEIRSVNFFSGVPLMGEAIDLSGGFGDVAANVVEAQAYARIHPNVVVNFIVTSNWHLETRNPEASSERILEIMVPGLDSKIRNTVQRIRGVNYLFFGEPLRYASHEKIEQVLPKADLSVNLSGGDHMRSIMELSSPVAFTAQEPSGKKEIVDFNAYTRADGVTRKHFFILNSGVETTGLYLSRPWEHREPRSFRPRLAQALEQAGIDVSITEDWEIGLAYTKGANLTLEYLRGVKVFAADPVNHARKFVLFAKRAHLDAYPEPSNERVRIVPFSGLPEETMRILYDASDLSPMVTGDVSSSAALGAITPEKGLMWELPYRLKSESADALVKKVAATATALGHFATLERADEAFRTLLVLNKGLWNGANVYKSLTLQPLWKTFFSSMAFHYNEWRITQNLAKYFRLIHLFQHEWNNHVFTDGRRGKYSVHGQMMEFLLRALNRAENWESFPMLLTQLMESPQTTPLQRVYCLVVLLKLEERIPESDHPVWTAAMEHLLLVAQTTRGSLLRMDFRKNLMTLLHNPGPARAFVQNYLEYLRARLPDAEQKYIDLSPSCGSEILPPLGLPSPKQDAIR